jgi:hypothetical protein
MNISRTASFACVLLLLAGAASAEDVKNPLYTGWAKFAVGSSATLTGQASANGRTVTVEITETLAEKKDNRVVTDDVWVIDSTGQPRKTQERRQFDPATMDKKNLAELGIEPGQALGRSIDCKVFEITGTNAQLPEATMKFWMNRTVPGGIVKMYVNSRLGAMTFVLQRYETKQSK